MEGRNKKTYWVIYDWNMWSM